MDTADRHTALDTARSYARHIDDYVEVTADRTFAGPLLNALSALLPPAATVVDLGCGPGWETGALEDRGFRAIGLDVTRSFLVQASGAHVASGYVVGDFLALPFADGAVDGTWASSSLVHLPWARIDSALREIARVLRSGGVFFASMQSGTVELLRESDGMPGAMFHYAYYQIEDWQKRLEAAGFEVLSLNQHGAGIDAPGRHGWIESLAART